MADVKNMLEGPRIDWAREQLDYRAARWLRSKGWVTTSSTPGCHWMWVKEIDGKSLYVSQSTAEDIQNGIDHQEYYKAHPDEIED